MVSDGRLRLAEFRDELVNDWKMESLMVWFQPRELGEIVKLQWPFVVCQDKLM